MVHEWDDELAGEAMPGGPVVLSWDAAANDPADERRDPRVRAQARHAERRRRRRAAAARRHGARGLGGAFEEAYEGFCDALERGKDTWLDPYAAEHPSEFFAVISEAFFEDPAETRRRYPDVYDQLKLFYKQDPS